MASGRHYTSMSGFSEPLGPVTRLERFDVNGSQDSLDPVSLFFEVELPPGGTELVVLARPLILPGEDMEPPTPETLNWPPREDHPFPARRLDEFHPQLPTMDLTAMKLAMVEGPTKRGREVGYSVTIPYGASM